MTEAPKVKPFHHAGRAGCILQGSDGPMRCMLRAVELIRQMSSKEASVIPLPTAEETATMEVSGKVEDSVEFQNVLKFTRAAQHKRSEGPQDVTKFLSWL